MLIYSNDIFSILLNDTKYVIPFEEVSESVLVKPSVVSMLTHLTLHRQH